MDLKWYQSKKFIAIIVGILAFVLNDRMGFHIDEAGLTGIVALIIAFVSAQFGLDMKDRNAVKNAMQDPITRDAIESLVSDFYDFALAKEDGISQHSLQVKEKVMDGLQLILDPKFHKDTTDISQEILRIVLKFYKEDQSMTKGADLVRSTLKKDGDSYGK
jgi:hypothetical protein